MASSKAFDEFISSIAMAEELLDIEQANYRDPPQLDEQLAVQGLRGGAIVLMVASWERYVKALFVECSEVLARNDLNIQFNKLPYEMQQCSVNRTLKWALNGPRYRKVEDPELAVNGPRKRNVEDPERTVIIEKACKDIIKWKIIPRAFGDVGNTMNSSLLNQMAISVGMTDIYRLIHRRFITEWGSGVNSDFIPHKLDYILNCRHKVAHKANVLDISRTDLEKNIKFLKILASLLDVALRKHIDGIVVRCVS